MIDDISTDRTADISRKNGARVIERKLNNNFSLQRNAALTDAKGEWVLFVDADEQVPLSLSYEILSYISDPMSKYAGFYVRRKDVMWGKNITHGETASVRLLRLAKRNAGKWTGAVHERWVVTGRLGELRNELLHFPHQTVTEFLEEVNWYTDLRAAELHAQKTHTPFWQIVVFPVGKFIQNYLLKLGLLDGMPGLIIALMMSFHSFLVRGKVWQLQKSV